LGYGKSQDFGLNLTAMGSNPRKGLDTSSLLKQRTKNILH